jgi:hypothetical protein
MIRQRFEQVSNGYRCGFVGGLSHGQRLYEFRQDVFEHPRHRGLQADQFQQPLVSGRFETDVHAGLARILTHLLQMPVEPGLKIQRCLSRQLPSQVHRAFTTVVGQRLAELHGRAFPPASGAVLGEGAQATVGAGLSAYQPGARRFAGRLQERVGRGQLPLSRDVVDRVQLLEDFLELQEVVCQQRPVTSFTIPAGQLQG